MINTLTSLRLFFALLVFISHLEIISEKFSRHIFTEGYVGVSFFFILSGFIIAYNYSDKVQSPEQKRKYYIARFARIYPLHLLTLVVAFAILLPPLGSPSTWVKLITSATLTNAFIPRSDFFFALNSPAWSLCCEQFFYITFPLIATSVKSRKNILIILSIYTAAIIIGSQLTPEGYTKGLWYVNPITRYADFIVGIAIYRIYRTIDKEKLGRWQATMLECASIVLFLLFYIYAEEVEKIYRYNIYYWLPTAAVILVFSLQKGLLSSFLSKRIFVIGGEISFGIYLTHFFIINAVGRYESTADAIMCSIAILAATIIISYASLRYFEKPVNTIIKKILT